MSLEDRKKYMGHDPKKEAEVKASQAKWIEKFKEHVNEVLSTESGEAVFRFLIDQCGFSKPTMAIKQDGGIDTESMLYNEARRSVYLNLRMFASPKLLAKIEYPEEKK